MPKGYVIFTEDIKDPAGMADYARAAGPAMRASAARPLVVTTTPTVLEGEWHGTQTVVLEFESVEAARAWYESPEYQAAAKLRHAAADTNAVIAAGFEPPKPAGS